MTSRSVARVQPAHRDDISDLTTRRPVPAPGLDQVDPFLFLNHHGPQTYQPGNNGLPFGPHPHRGFETVTFILEGNLAHHDTGGHESVIEAGGVQWMTAGSGLIHAEVSPPSFKRTGGPLEILQLWVNLPGRLKMNAPAYTGLQQADIPQVSVADGKGTLSLIAGGFGEVVGPIHPLTGVFMTTLRLASGGRMELPAPRDRSVLLYVVSGRLAVAGVVVDQWNLVTMNPDGDKISIGASTDTVLLFGHADPIGEPVVAHGPFVMNTSEEIGEAIRDYQAGKFNGTGPLVGVGA
ncbi:pirin family protein [Sphingomonas naphthae]|uniref:Pirin family protein n=1 Tax=Sphingomonas naphthae TaxID=1813468 RepID=A0ABY7TIB8_9SPHN|nr:pirin family protein [Sphingomonas naphthae]WCT72653.1 pirin family protein [Sphingomonas naphthae]